MVGGLGLLLLVVLGGALLARRSGGGDSATRPTATVAAPSPSPPTTTVEHPTSSLSIREPTTSVAGTGPAASLTPSQAAGMLKQKQLEAMPDIPVGTVACPPGPYKVGHLVLCRVLLSGTPVIFWVKVTGDLSIDYGPAKPVIDTDKAEKLIEAKEPGTTADCGSPRIRQFDVGATFACRTATSTWNFSVLEKGIEGTRR
ncbi:MAG: hypothetical protein ABIS47_10530 [Acidimicrobiales bacterium]